MVGQSQATFGATDALGMQLARDETRGRPLVAIDQMISGYGRRTVTSRRSGCDQT
jgi:hypothetical protein